MQYRSKCPRAAANVICFAALLFPLLVHAETHFLEAESFVPSSAGWQAVSNDQTQRASRVKTMWGADGPGDATASAAISIHDAAPYRIWVRANYVEAWRGAFTVAVSSAEREIATAVFDREPLPDTRDWDYVWKSFDAELPPGEVVLTLGKFEHQSCSGYVRHVDCFLITTDKTLAPDHIPYGPQTFIRFRLGDGYAKPAYLLLFADHYREPWYSYHALGRAGINGGLRVPTEEMLQSGDVTPWANISHVVYQDSGVALDCTVRYAYEDRADRLRGTLEFGRAPDADPANVTLIKSYDLDCAPNGVVVVVPPDLESPENIAHLQRDGEIAEATGRLADAFDWPTFGRTPTRLPFLVSANIGGYDIKVGDAVRAREQKTLDYFGFNGSYDRIVHGAWLMKNESYCSPDLDAMRERAQQAADLFRKENRNLDSVAACMLTDEPGGQPASFVAKDPAYRDAFTQWIKMQGLTPADVLEPNWDAVRPVDESERTEHPGLHYFTQRFRTVALGNFMAAQRAILESAYGRAFPCLANFSDGAVYAANFYAQGVDYFELMNRGDMNAIWGEDWANNASTYQCAAYNVDLMRAATRKRGQTVGHYLIAHAGRTAWDTQLKAASETARGVRIWMNFAYGPSWGTHEGGPAWKSHVWYAKPAQWKANAEIAREIGAVEDWLLTAKPAPAQVALLYASSSDIWSMDNFAYGFDRMHTWLALAHAQMPVDIVSETDVAEGQLAPYRVCYLSGPNITRAAAVQLKAWVEAGGTLFLTAGAGSRDEYNRPLEVLSPILPADRNALTVHEGYQGSGLYLSTLQLRGTVAWGGEQLEVLAVQQPQVPHANASVLATFGDGSAAVLSAPAGQGHVFSAGFLPALSYIKPALVARQRAEKEAKTNGDQPAQSPLAVSYNPWEFSGGIRERLLAPVRAAGVDPVVKCGVPLVDAVYLPCTQGALIALANYTLTSQQAIELRVRHDAPVSGVESLRLGALPFRELSESELVVSVPLEASDWIKILPR